MKLLIRDLKALLMIGHLKEKTLRGVVLYPECHNGWLVISKVLVPIQLPRRVRKDDLPDCQRGSLIVSGAHTDGPKSSIETVPYRRSESVNLFAANEASLRLYLRMSESNT